MLRSITLAALSIAFALPAVAQDAPVATAPTIAPYALPANVSLPAVAGAIPDPTCGGREAMSQLAYCIASTQGGLQVVADGYTSGLEATDWLVAAGEDNRIVFVRRRDGGGCDGLQMQAFTPDGATPDANAPAYLAFAVIPGDVCAAQPPAAGSSAQ